ncbi:MAG: zinc ribbon domain-containing protein [Thermoplasmata archaeon]
MTIQEFFKKINEARWGMLFYLLLIVPFSVLFYLLQSCLYVFFVVFVAMAVPYYAGMRGPKKFAILGVFILITNSLAFGAVSTQRAYDYANYYSSYESTMQFVEPQANELGNLSQGVVTPRVGDPGTLFTFSVIYTHEGNITPKYVHVNVSTSFLIGLGDVQNLNMTPAEPGDTDYSDGARYEVTRSLPSLMDPRVWEVPNHYFFFGTEDANGTYTNTTIKVGDFLHLGLGPMNAEYFDVFYPNVIWGFSNMIWIIALFYLVVMMYWWLRRAKMRADEWQSRVKKMEEEESEYECDRCGADVPADVEKCPRCGATFDEEEEEEEEGEDEEEEDEEEEE